MNVFQDSSPPLSFPAESAYYDSYFFLCSGYLVTSPRIFRAGSTQELSVSLIDVNEPWIINSTVSYKKGGDEIASDGAQFTGDADGTLKLKVKF